MVKEEYQIINGFSGMKRDIILQLCKLLWWDVGKIKVVLISHHFIIFSDNWSLCGILSVKEPFIFLKGQTEWFFFMQINSQLKQTHSLVFTSLTDTTYKHILCICVVSIFFYTYGYIFYLHMLLCLSVCFALGNRSDNHLYIINKWLGGGKVPSFFFVVYCVNTYFILFFIYLSDSFLCTRW
jgi:hypothetical protein